MTNSPLREIKKDFQYRYFNPMEALEQQKVDKETVDFFMRRLSRDEPISYYVNYVRYLKNVVVIFPKKSVYGKIVLMLSKGETSKGFISCKIDNLENLIKVHMSFLDLVKLHIIVKLKMEFGLNDMKLKSIFLLLRFNANIIPVCEKGKLTNNTYWYLHNATSFRIGNDLETVGYAMNEDELPDEIKTMREEIKSKGAFVVVRYDETDAFEKLLYYALNYRKSAFISINAKNKSQPISYVVNGADIGHLDDGIIINVLRLLQHSQIMEWENNPSREILWEQGLSHIGGEQKKKKEKYIEGLQKKLAQTGIHTEKKKAYSDEEMKKNLDEFRKLSALINKAIIELDFGFYDVEEGTEETEQSEYPVWQKDIEEFLKHKLNGQFTLEVSQGEIEYASEDFSTSDLSTEKYLELKEHVGGYGHVTPDEYNGRVTRYVGRKTHKYGKKEADN